MHKKLFAVLLALCLVCNLSACAAPVQDIPVTTTLPAAEPAPSLPEPTAAMTEPEGPILLDRPESGKVCVGFMPTETGSWRYVVLADQEAAVAAYEKAAGAIYSDEWWIKGDRTKGLMVIYGEIWDFVESGELVYALGRVKAEDAADLYALCANAAREAGWQEGGVLPQQITGVTSALLRQGDTAIPLTDPAALDTLEAMLSQATFVLGGTGCPFSALLDLELETGETLTVALATDSCGSWMSEGNYYDFGSDSQPLYDLFGVTLEFGTLQQ